MEEKRLWPVEIIEKGLRPERGIDRFFDSLEIVKVLSMDIPVALVVELPRRGRTFETPIPDFADIILCFPCHSCVHAYLYSVKDGKYHFKDLGKYGNGEEHSKVKDKMIKEYKYVVSLRPFLHHIENKTGIVKFRFQISDIGFDVIEITIFFDDDNRENEWVNIDYCEGSNESDYWSGEGRKHIAKLVRKNTKNGYVWESVEEKPEIDELPFVRGYMSQEE
jgi:hypothetical protein